MKQRWCLLTLKHETITVQFSYDAESIEALKRAIPHTQHTWDEVTKTWTVVGLTYLDWLTRFAKTFKHAQLQRGDVVTNLHTGQIVEQLQLW